MTEFEHDMYSPVYRLPRGAQQTGSRVRFALGVRSERQTIESVYLCFSWGLYSFSTDSRRMLPMQHSDGMYAVVQTLPSEPGLFFYWFKINFTDGHVEWCVRHHENLRKGVSSSVPPSTPDCAFINGSPVAHKAGPDPSRDLRAFRITIYDRDFRTPDWFKSAVVYQVFPDRYARSENFDIERLKSEFNRPGRIWHDSWDEEVDWEGRDGAPYTASDFFGGSLQGITDELDRLAALGITCIYLNPICVSPSNHRYDTEDYFLVDPILGTLEDFRILCAEASWRSIRIILDGVFNHTGADSKYFNREGRYEQPGAWQDRTEGAYSPYTDWYTFFTDKDELCYDSWWGFENLPAVRKHSLDFQEFIAGPDGVVEFWLRQGASGWRLDVSDELSDSFIRKIRKRIKQVKPDAVLIGEVWEDASCKHSYGSFRDFALGRTHDSVMGYLFRDAVLSFLSGRSDGAHLESALLAQYDHYPPEFLCATMNLLGSHDVSRLLNELSGREMPDQRCEQAEVELTDQERVLAMRRAAMAFTILMAYPGAPCIYYGDEYGLEGCRDPFNRRTLPVDREEGPLYKLLSELIACRHRNGVLRTGTFHVIWSQNDVLVGIRNGHEDTDMFGQPYTGSRGAVILLNRGDADWEVPELIIEIAIHAAFDGFAPDEWRQVGSWSLPACSAALVLSNQSILTDDYFPQLVPTPLVNESEI